MGLDEARTAIQVELVWSPQAGDVRHVWLSAFAGESVETALRACPAFAEQLLRLADLKIGVWGRLRALDTPLRDRDRIEVYRPLTVDPKEARRQRYRDRGERIVSRHRPLGGKTSR
ncbi:RnfH family protein [Paucibacter sp. AS339]|uniref:RnfH family protein n=1 Tax=Paucibacter hankyongi TaxID=3133434 RepID=UPI0030A754DF